MYMNPFYWITIYSMLFNNMLRKWTGGPWIDLHESVSCPPGALIWKIKYLVSCSSCIQYLHKLHFFPFNNMVIWIKIILEWHIHFHLHWPRIEGDGTRSLYHNENIVFSIILNLQLIIYIIQHYVIKFVSDLRQVSGFLRVLRSSPPIKPTATI
jgi:hypothetical protein